MFELEPNDCRGGLPVSVSVEYRVGGSYHGKADVERELIGAEIYAVHVAQWIHVVLLNRSTVPHLFDCPRPLLAEIRSRKSFFGLLKFIFDNIRCINPMIIMSLKK